MASKACNSFKVIEQSWVAPPPGSVSKTTIALTFFDVRALYLGLMQFLFFYEFPHPTLHFTQNILPILNQSLSLTLRNFFPLAANLTCPVLPQKPYLLYDEENHAGVQVTTIESDEDFHSLVCSHTRDMQALQSLVPKLPTLHHLLPNTTTTHVMPVMAISFTVFPNSGVSLGLTVNHAVADGTSVNDFVKFWASINRSSQGENMTFLSLPFHNKDVIEDPNGLLSVFLQDLLIPPSENLMPKWPVVDNVPPDNVLVTLVMKRKEIEQLKQWIVTVHHHHHHHNQSKTLEDQTQEIRMSTYVVTCAFMWVNLIKLQDQIRGTLDGDGDGDDMVYHFLAPADCRERIIRQIPKTYFGNCLTHIHASLKRRELMGEFGLVIAAKTIRRKIIELAGKDKSPFEGAKKYWESTRREILEHGRVVTVASSLRLRVYEVDFGWGRPEKSEMVHIGSYNCFSLTDSRDGDGGVEIGVVVGRDKLELFNGVFEKPE